MRRKKLRRCKDKKFINEVMLEYIEEYGDTKLSPFVTIREWLEQYPEKFRLYTNTKRTILSIYFDTPTIYMDGPTPDTWWNPNMVNNED